MSELIKNPKAMEKAHKEMREAMQGKTKLEESDIFKFSYLNLVIKETLRLHSPTHLLLPRVCRETCERASSLRDLRAARWTSRASTSSRNAIAILLDKSRTQRRQTPSHSRTFLLLPRVCTETCEVMRYGMPAGARVLINAFSLDIDEQALLQRASSLRD
ncbi:hypothetical protein ZIOFF_043006 [Zingiber officinale]|uniref:Cytochrome P450 n=1 Tax=Zingiber officinale TaxID=94328 RepID=A0A8J5FU76_ZINOF|nr:hypothetical protein ZIOFF_043006 [Zingiber officinale]